MPRTHLALLVIGLMGPIAGAADAVPPVVTLRQFLNYCSPGAFRTCQSLEIRTVTTSTGTDLLFRWRNEQGSSWGYDNTGPVTFGEFYVTAYIGSGEGYRDFGDEAGYRAFGDLIAFTYPHAEGNVAAFGPEPASWDAYFFSGYLDDTPDPGRAWFDPGNNHRAVWGCDVGYQGRRGPEAYLQTCARDGLDGWIAFGFRSAGAFTADELWIHHSMSGESGVDGRKPGAGCTFYVAQGTSDCIHVTPEPMTVALLGTGLLGIGGALSRRRSRGPGAAT